MAVKLIAFDLDGTLLNSEKRLTDATRDALKAAAERGILLVPATGRLYPGVPAELKTALSRYFILGNGVTVYDSAENRRICSHEMELDTAMRLFGHADSIGCFYDCYADDEPWISRSVFERLPELIEDRAVLLLMKQLRKPVPDLRKMLESRGKSVQKVQIYFTDPALRREQLKSLPELFPECSVTSSMYCNAEICSIRATKGAALLSLCGELGIDPAETMAIGDGLNDVSMLKAAGTGVAMANADEGAKAAARFITRSCDENGAAEAIIKYALVQRESNTHRI